MCPEDPIEFILASLKILKENGLSNLSWAVFIDESMRSPARFLHQYSQDVFDWDDIERPAVQHSKIGHRTALSF